MQRILSAEDIASPPFQDWLKEQNDAGADIISGHQNCAIGVKEKRRRLCSLRSFNWTVNRASSPKSNRSDDRRDESP
jgi:hypothetical protein